MGRQAEIFDSVKAVSAYSEAVVKTTGIFPHIRAESIRGENFLVVSVPLGDRYEDLDFRSRTDDAIAASVLQRAPEYIGAVVVEYVR